MFRRECVIWLKEDIKENLKCWDSGGVKRRCVIWLKADIKENPKWWVCGECTRLRVRVADRVLLLCMSGAFCRLLSTFVDFCRLRPPKNNVFSLTNLGPRGRLNPVNSLP